MPTGIAPPDNRVHATRPHPCHPTALPRNQPTAQQSVRLPPASASDLLPRHRAI